MFQLEFLNEILLTECCIPFKNSNKLQELKVVFDPGCAVTLIDTSEIDLIGYSAAKDGIRKSVLDGAAGFSEGFVISVPCFKCLEMELKDFKIACHDLNSKLGISGLLGMNFFKHFKIDMSYSKGVIYNIMFDL